MVQIQYAPFNKITSILLWFLNGQAKAFTEVFFIYKMEVK
nr:MAG TPA: hypothetical protein [Caudoviricetes sp.]